MPTTPFIAVTRRSDMTIILINVHNIVSIEKHPSGHVFIKFKNPVTQFEIMGMMVTDRIADIMVQMPFYHCSTQEKVLAQYSNEQKGGE